MPIRQETIRFVQPLRQHKRRAYALSDEKPNQVWVQEGPCNERCQDTAKRLKAYLRPNPTKKVDVYVVESRIDGSVMKVSHVKGRWTLTKFKELPEEPKRYQSPHEQAYQKNNHIRSIRIRR